MRAIGKTSAALVISLLLQDTRCVQLRSLKPLLQDPDQQTVPDDSGFSFKIGVADKNEEISENNAAENVEQIMTNSSNYQQKNKKKGSRVQSGNSGSADQQIQIIKESLNELETEITKQHNESGKKKDYKEIAAIIKKFHNTIPEVEKVAKMLKNQKDSDPFLKQMITDLSEAINSEKLHQNINKAKLDFINQTNGFIHEVDPDRESTFDEKIQQFHAMSKAKTDAEVSQAEAEAKAQVDIIEANGQADIEEQKAQEIQQQWERQEVKVKEESARQVQIGEKTKEKLIF